MDDPIDRSLERADENRVGGTLPDARREFQRDPNRPMAGETILARLATRFSPRTEARDTGRDQSRR